MNHIAINPDDLPELFLYLISNEFFRKRYERMRNVNAYISFV